MPEFFVWKGMVLERDNYMCQACHSRGNVIAHHIISINKIAKDFGIKDVIEARKCELLWDIDNGVTLCPECHKLTDNFASKAFI